MLLTSFRQSRDLAGHKPRSNYFRAFETTTLVLLNEDGKTSTSMSKALNR
jgi:hypothetical protein